MRHKPEHMNEFQKWVTEGYQATYIPSTCSICDGAKPSQVMYDAGLRAQTFLCQPCYQDFQMVRDTLQFLITREGKIK